MKKLENMAGKIDRDRVCLVGGKAWIQSQLPESNNE